MAQISSNTRSSDDIITRQLINLIRELAQHAQGLPNSSSSSKNCNLGGSSSGVAEGASGGFSNVLEVGGETVGNHCSVGCFVRFMHESDGCVSLYLAKKNDDAPTGILFSVLKIVSLFILG